ncbi:alkyl hydroperoxide reductase [Lewinellaceae bacterium SD302]|nr:alkyl hydroperoxide reductase [Lewinellaceae bacterium SD302]
MNAVYEAAQGYASTLSRAVGGDKANEVLNRLFDKWPAGSKARLFSLGGAFNGLNQAKSPAALPVAERLVAEYEATEPAAVATVKKSFSKLLTSTPGAQAPNLVGPSPDGETVDLKDLRGKVVLVDFWASWCGPCRKENPRVKKLYDKYADKGFEILGVSLDRSKERWVQAIEKDGLGWLHMSDLQHWKSAHAAIYGVRSIPDTVLLDAEGKIIARGLRGQQLEAKLAEIFSGK